MILSSCCGRSRLEISTVKRLTSKLASALTCWILGCLLAGMLAGCADRDPPESGALIDQERAADPAAATPPQGSEAAGADPVDEEFAGLPLSEELYADGWIALFDGHSLFGWESNNPEVNWSVRDGVISADAGPKGLLNTTSPFSDYELVCEFRMEEEGNSGIFLRTIAQPADVQTDCYELNIADGHPEGFTTGAIVGRAKTAEPIIGSGGWKTFHVRADGNRITVQLDGAEVLDFTDETAVRSSGRIGLQRNTGKIEFRNIRLRPLGMEPLFDGEDLAGWREVPGSKSEFRVADSEIQVVNGQGFIETEREFGDFLFQCDAITHGEELNSGFFFRAQPGTEDAPSNGYEVQIHNGVVDGDPAKPANAGTGAIFRRTEARRVVSQDNEWCTITLAANGNHFAVWVNGYQVTDWTDEREAHENPRQGRRDEPGHISLQGHDPTTDLSFRRLHIAELPTE